VNTLVLRHVGRALRYALFSRRWRDLTVTGQIEHYQDSDHDPSTLRRIVQEINDTVGTHGPDVQPDLIALRSVFGGSVFRGPILLNAEGIAKLDELIPQAPLHLPLLLKLVDECRGVWPGLPVVVTFETAFFVALPPREHLYALDAEVVGNPDLRRYGYHGLFHEAACRHVAHVRKRRGFEGTARTISICLEPQPEVAAVIGHRPVMVTSGATPLEGIPGHTTCGEIDPSVVLALAERMEWGPEQINTVLTQQSGLLGLTGRQVTLDETFQSDAHDLELARQVVEYRILQACGAAIAAMGGLDVVVFSGRYAAVGRIMSPRLLSRLYLKGQSKPQVLCSVRSLDSAIAEGAANIRCEPF